MPNSYPAIVADMLSDAIGCIGFSWIASPACTGHLIFLWNKKKTNKLLKIQTFETSEYSIEIEIHLFFYGKAKSNYLFVQNWKWWWWTGWGKCWICRKSFFFRVLVEVVVSFRFVLIKFFFDFKLSIVWVPRIWNSPDNKKLFTDYNQKKYSLS